MWYSTPSSVFLLNIFLTQLIDGLRLTDHIGHYDSLDYSQDLLRERHLRSKRSVYDKVISFNITADGRTLPLLLYPDSESRIFHPEAVIDFKGKQQKLDTSHIFIGHIEGDAGSQVHGAIIDGIFEGRLELSSGDKYQIERKSHYLDNTDLSGKDHIHSVIYNDDHVDVEKFFADIRARRSADSSKEFCGNDANHEWMEEIRSSSIYEKRYSHRAGHDLYTAESNGYSSRDKRQTNTRTTCNLFLQGDPELWTYFKKTNPQADDVQIRDMITSLFYSHVKEVDGIFRSHTFKDGFDQSYRQFGFRIDRVLVDQTCDCLNTNECQTNTLCNSAIDASNLLNINSYNNHDAYCLAYIFTYRDFEGGTLGLAWVAEPGTDKGGICSEYTAFAAVGGAESKSLNTGIVTIENYQKRVPPLVTKITFAHELGHNFGSQHDEEGLSPSCTPFTDNGSPQGNYIMFASATEGTKDNNRNFSSCSIRKIGDVLRVVVNEQSGKVNCFQESDGAWCGNQIKEEEEVCDCGYTEDCLTGDCCPCCYGQNDQNNFADACKLRQGVVCDPSQGACCNGMCGYHNTTTKCASEGECTAESMCDGSAAACPKPDNKDDNTPCNQNTQVCKEGDCKGSICELIMTGDKSWVECEPTRDDEDPTLLCHVACAPPDNTTAQCYSSSNSEDDGFPLDFKLGLENLSNETTKIAYLAGHVCDKEKGFCDHFQKCRLVNGKGPLARLKDLIFSESTLQLVTDWVTVYWWAVALSIIGFVALMVLFVKCCAVHTPSSNPKKAKARKLSQTLTLRRRQAGGGARRPPEQRGPPLLPERNSHQMNIPADTRSQPPAYTSLAAEPANQPRPRSAMPQGSRPRSAMPPQGSRPASHQPPRGQQRPSQSREARQQQYELQQQQLSRQQRRH